MNGEPEVKTQCVLSACFVNAVLRQADAWAVMGKPGHGNLINFKITTDGDEKSGAKRRSG